MSKATFVQDFQLVDYLQTDLHCCLDCESFELHFFEDSV